MVDNAIKIGRTIIDKNSATYFIADIAANHDGDLEKAKELIWMAKEAGADAAKFQHFNAKTIVSDFGFKTLGTQLSHQSSWTESVFETYKNAEVPLKWTEILYKECKDANIDFFTSPYDINTINEIDPYVVAYKVGSGDINYYQIIEEMMKYNKPIIIATGASNLSDVKNTMNMVYEHGSDIVLMQCNTNYTAKYENFKYINLNVLDSYKKLFPRVILGLSDHTVGHTTVLGAIAKGAKVIEKHFTDNNSLKGPDHKFSMNPSAWKEMVERSRELELALGDGVKRIEDNEKETAILQRRSVQVNRFVPRGKLLTSDMLIALRPAPKESIPPYLLDSLVGKRVLRDLAEGESILKGMVEDD